MKGTDDNRQRMATFIVTTAENFVPMQVIYTGKTKRYLANVEFQRSFTSRTPETTGQIN